VFDRGNSLEVELIIIKMSFNHMQSEMANVLANSDDNVIVSAPTGAGKTALFEMAMARLFASI
jgi:ATP-dependent DNA helicase HFM1/MER3